MKILLILTFDVPAADDIPEVLEKLDPPHLPYFTGLARITVEPYATAVENYLDDLDELTD